MWSRKRTNKGGGMKEKKVKRFVMVDLTEQEIMDKSKTLGELGIKLNEIELEKKSIMSDYTSKITALRENMTDYFTILSERKEHREVECIVEMNNADSLVEYYYNGILVDSRPMVEGDKQEELI